MSVNAPESAVELARKESHYIKLLKQNDGLLSRICRSFAVNEADYKDLKQDAMINIWNGLDLFRNESDIRTWLYRVILNTCVSTYRKRKKFQSASIEEAENISSAKDVYEDIQWINTLLASLTPDNHAIMLMWLDGLEYEEIGEIMGLNRNTIATKIRRAKEKLKQLIKINEYGY